MASFTFGSGNSRKLLGIPLYALAALVTACIPRRDDVWVFGCGIGPAEGALPLYRAARLQLGDGHRLVWMARSSAELALARSFGLDTVRKDGWKGFWLTARARVIVVTHGFGDVNRYGTRGGFVVQLWHGVPLKHLHLDSPSTYSVSFLPDLAIVRRLVGLAYRRAGQGLSLFTVAGRSVVPSIVSAFGVPADRVVVTGDVRDDVLLRGTEDERTASARTHLASALSGLPEGARTVLFAPTWRDGEADPTVPTADEWRLIAAWLETHDAVLLVRTHPLGRGDFHEGSRISTRIRMLDIETLREINQVLWAIDVVVTDYSSLVFDYSLVGRPVVFFAPDLETYTRTRGFYRPYAWFSGGRSVSAWPAVLDRLDEALHEGAEGPGHRHADAIREEIFDHTDGNAAERVLAEIRSRVGQRTLERDYRRSDAPLQDAVFFESFYGKQAACNPLGIDTALAALRPATRRYWSVADASVNVPDGAVAVVEGSAAWWRARGTSRVLVVNDWLRKRYRRRAGQHVLQTWHGSTFKRLARDRPDATWRSRLAARREGARWDALLAQNEFSADHLRSAYAFKGPVWIEGYPRNDVLAHPERATEIRAVLGIPTDAKIVLYAPTWREDRTTMIDVLDPALLAGALGPDAVVLVRGHSRTVQDRPRPSAPGVRDVTGHPDMADLLLIADVFVTDYSSAMFDWMTTGRPIVFFVPDLDRYRDDLRGFYADLLAAAPGPVVAEPEALVDAVLHAEERAPAYADVAATWQQTFTPLDDGGAGRRVVSRMIAEGWFGRP